MRPSPMDMSSACSSVPRVSDLCLAGYFRRHGVLYLQTGSAWLINAEWLFVEIVAGGRVGAGAATHADVAKLAAAAFALQVVGIAQFD